jgi:hypothetical protein
VAEDLQAIVHPAGGGLDELPGEHRVLAQEREGDLWIAERIDEALEPLLRRLSVSPPAWPARWSSRTMVRVRRSTSGRGRFRARRGPAVAGSKGAEGKRSARARRPAVRSE